MTELPAPVRPFRGVSAEQRMQQRRDALLEAGLSALADGKRDTVTVDQVSSRAGVSKRYFYEHFQTRNDLFVALAERLVGQLTAAVAAATQAPPTDPVDRITDAISRVFAVLVEDPRNARLFVDLIGGDQLKATVDRTEHAIAGMLVDALLPPAGVPDAERTRLDLAALILVAGSAQAVSDWLDDRIELTQAELIEQICRMSVASLRTARPDL